MPKIFSAYERSSLCEAGRSPESNAFLTDIMNTDPKQTNRNARKSETPSYKYSFWFNEEHIRFKKLLCKSGLEHNRSQFIVKRIFGEEFVVIKRDPSKTQFIARLNDFYFQFQKLGNNSDRYVGAANKRIKGSEYRDSELCETYCGVVANTTCWDRSPRTVPCHRRSSKPCAEIFHASESHGENGLYHAK